MFCRGCGYDLHGLPASRCPECGAGFDPADAATFGSARRQGLWRRALAAARARRRMLSLLSTVLALVLIEETCSNWERTLRVCTHCGAHAEVDSVAGLELSVTYRTKVSEGPASRFVQSVDGRRCPHQWQTYQWAGGGFVFGRWTGIGRHMRLWLRVIDGTPDADALLARRAAMDPTFTTKFLDFVRTNDHARYESFLEEFWAWAEEQGQQTTRAE